MSHRNKLYGLTKCADRKCRRSSMRPRFCMCILNNPYPRSPKCGVNVRVEVGQGKQWSQKKHHSHRKKRRSHKNLPDPTSFFLLNITYKTGVSTCLEFRNISKSQYLNLPYQYLNLPWSLQYLKKPISQLASPISQLASTNISSQYLKPSQYLKLISQSNPISQTIPISQKSISQTHPISQSQTQKPISQTLFRNLIGLAQIVFIFYSLDLGSWD